MIVLKFGGTSVGRQENLARIVEILSTEGRKIAVLSAFPGTTDQLIRISDLAMNFRQHEAIELVRILRQDHIEILKPMFSDPVYRGRALDILDDMYARLHRYVSPEAIKNNRENIIVLGEYISTHLFQLYLESRGIPSVLLDALNFMRMDRDREPDMLYIQENIGRLLDDHIGQGLFITQGFVCRNYDGNTDHWSRGGSDYTASLIGAVLKAVEIQIWTDTDGIHNNDPRFVTETRSVRELSYKEAAELAYFGAKILHPKCVFPAQKHQIPLRIKNTSNPTDPGTLISSASVPDHIRSVAAKDGIIAIRIRSGRMLMAYGFLKKVFQVFEDFQTPIDMITTSEVSISLTIDDARNLDAILGSLKQFGEVEYDLDQSIICVVGDFMAEKTGMAGMIMNALIDIPIRMISYGGSMNNISVLVRSADKKRALEALHQKIFVNNSKEHVTTETHSSF